MIQADRMATLGILVSGVAQPRNDQGLLRQESGLPQDGLEIIFPERLPALKEVKKIPIDETPKRTIGNQTIAGQMLGPTRRALNNRLRQITISKLKSIRK